MCDKLKCEVVRDLLPNYIEGLTSAETNDAVFRHMEECNECKKLYEKLKADMAVPKIDRKDLQRLFRAIRKAKLTQIILAVLGGAVLTWVVVFIMSSGFSVISPEEIQMQNIYQLSDGSMVIEYKVPGLDVGMRLGNSGIQFGNGDYAFEIRTSFWNRLFGRSNPNRETFYEHIHILHSLSYDSSIHRDVWEPFVIYYGNGDNRRLLWRRGDKVEIATPEFEIFMRGNTREKYEDFLEDYLWRQSVTTPNPTMIPGKAPN